MSDVFEKGRRQGIINDDMSKALKLAAFKTFLSQNKMNRDK